MNTARLPPEVGEEVDIEAAQQALYDRLTIEVPGYVDWFEAAFDRNIEEATPAEVWTMAGKAIAVYLRDIVSKDSDFDRWNAGDDAAMDPAAVRGFELFTGKGRCIACHRGPFLTDFAFHNISTDVPDPDGTREDGGRQVVTGEPADGGKFLTPSLRSVAKTVPYFHDGSASNIEEAIRRHVEQQDDPAHDPILRGMEPLRDAEIEDLKRFLVALNGQPLSLGLDGVLVDIP